MDQEETTMTTHEATTPAEAMTLDADGKVTEVWFLANDQAAYDEYWSSQ